MDKAPNFCFKEAGVDVVSARRRFVQRVAMRDHGTMRKAPDLEGSDTHKMTAIKVEDSVDVFRAIRMDQRHIGQLGLKSSVLIHEFRNGGLQPDSNEEAFQKAARLVGRAKSLLEVAGQPGMEGRAMRAR